MNGSGQRRTTIKDVAEAAGVGVATVSRVLSGGSASAGTREKVLATAARLDYHPSALGRNLRRRHTGGIGLLVPDITDSFYARLADGVLSCARSYGEPVTVGVTGDDPERESELIGTLIEQSMDRVIAVPSGDGEVWDPVLRAGVNVVFASRRSDLDLPDVPAVLADDRDGVRTAVEYLTGLGHRKIAFLARRGQSQRVAAFTGALTALGVPVEDELVVHARASRDSAYAAAAGLLQRHPDVTAVLTGGNILGEAAVLAARELDVRVPRDVSLIMFDDVPWAELCSPPLTVIAQPAQDIGYRSAELVLRQGRRPREVVLPSELVVRASCGPRRPRR
ncbi:LacI family DNA-binding transcriptional regulator [Microtetraspora malaysiensis]|uniref:LacI family DNA-binding transcriptional regulator n=1 Tax=Microtetraspora malaysiensis TaxID=161358 RepID=UPI0008295207|nr:LacI family DNA-binding transcriptional regulator [Microtetraspora malaysiensis]